MAHADWIIDLGPGAGHDAVGSSSRALPRNWSPTAPPSPESTSRHTSAADRAPTSGVDTQVDDGEVGPVRLLFDGHEAGVVVDAVTGVVRVVLTTGVLAVRGGLRVHLVEKGLVEEVCDVRTVFLSM